MQGFSYILAFIFPVRLGPFTLFRSVVRRRLSLCASCTTSRKDHPHHIPPDGALILTCFATGFRRLPSTISAFSRIPILMATLSVHAFVFCCQYYATLVVGCTGIRPNCSTRGHFVTVSVRPCLLALHFRERLCPRPVRPSLSG